MINRKTISAIVVSALIGVSVTNSVYAKDLNVKVDGILQTLQISPASQDDYTLFSMQDLFEVLGVVYVWDISDYTVTAKNDEIEAVFKIGKRDILVNDKVKYMPVAPKFVENEVMLPMRYIVELFGAVVDFDRLNNTIVIKTDKNQFVVLDSNSLVTSKSKVLTYDEALKTAISRNNSIKSLQDNIDLLNESREKYESLENRAWYAGQDKTAIDMMRGINAIDTQLSSIEPNEEMIKGSTEYLLRNYLVSIKTNLIDTQLLKESLGIQKENVRMLELKESMGLASLNDVRVAKQAVEQSESSLNSLRIALQNDRASLNQLIGEYPDRDVVVLFEEDLMSLPTNIDVKIPEKIKEDPSIVLKEKAIDKAKYDLDTSVTTGQEADVYNMTGQPPESKLEKENAYEQALRDLDDAKESMEKALREAYGNMKLLLEKQKSLELDLQKAKDNYDTTVVSYEAGIVTMFDVNQVKLAILQAEVALEKNSISFNNAAFGYERPFLLSGR